MKRKLNFLFYSLFLIPFSFVFADVPVVINYVGHIEGDELTGKEKVLLMSFRLYDRPGSGKTIEKQTALWGRQASVSLSGGNFDVDLKDTFGAQLADTKHVSLADAIAEALENGSSNLYLGLTPANDTNPEIYPRQRLTAVPKALQARAVRTIPSDFTSENGTFTTEGPLKVDGSSRMSGDVSYGGASFGPDATATFKGGVNVAGTLRANAVSATTLKSETVAAKTAETGASGTLSVSGRLDAGGTTAWHGDLKSSSMTASVTRVEASVETATIDVERLVASNFVYGVTSTPIYKHNGSWRLIGTWNCVSQNVEQHEVHNINVYDPRRGTEVTCQAISIGSWEVPSDCLALFQTHIENTKANEPACVQFYIVSDPNFNAYNAVKPIGVAMLSNEGTLDSVVPLLLRKGQLVKWLCYNDNANDAVGVKHYDQTTVTEINYQTFGW